jgi:hypothetical protein
MSAGTAGRTRHGQPNGWDGVAVNAVAIGAFDDVAESNLYDPPIMVLVALAAGNIVVTLDGDDTADASKKQTLAVLSGWANKVTGIAIRKIWATNTTVSAANTQGFR